MIGKLANSGLILVGAGRELHESYKVCRNKFKYKNQLCCMNSADQELIILFNNSTFYFNEL